MREFRSISSAQSSNPRGSTHSHLSLLVIWISDPSWQAAGLWEPIQERGGWVLGTNVLEDGDQDAWKHS